MHMIGLEEALYQQMSVVGALYMKLNCKNTAECIRKNIGRYDKDFLDMALKALYGDIRSMKFAEEVGRMNPRLAGTMRKSTLTSMDQLMDKLSIEPSKRAKYRRIGVMPFDVERNWFMNRFNADVQKISETMPQPRDDPELFVKKVFKLYTSFAKNIHKPYGDVYKYCIKNILGSNAKEIPSLIEENFSFDSVYLQNGRAMSDLRYLRKAYREKRYFIKGTKISFEGVDPSFPRIEYDIWDLLFMVLFLQMKVCVLSSVFCIVDVNKMMGAVQYFKKH